MQIITSPDNRHLKLARKLKQHKFREREKRFLLEGKVPVKEALSKHGDLVETIFVTDRQADWLARQPHDGAGAWQIDEREMARLCDTTTPQGVIAVVRHPGYDLAVTMAESGLLLYLEEIGDPGNLGSMIRSAQAMEVAALLLSPGCADAFSPKVIRSSMGSILSLPIFQPFTHQSLRELKNEGFRVLGSSPGGATELYGCDLNGRAVVALGSEAAGMSPELTGLCDINVKIPINSQVESLNVAAACAIILAEAYRQRCS